MSNVYFIGDLHFGHEKVTKFRTEFTTVVEHDEYICSIWESKIGNKDIVYVCGDAAFTLDGLERIASLPGRKFLVRGNHDVFQTVRYLAIFDEVCGFVKYKHNKERYWISHCPIHPDELRDGKNIHGHVHTNTILDKLETALSGREVLDRRYFNVSAENIGYEPKTIDELIRMRTTDLG
jgi:calcineurin-like phosphoesterase family protein